MGWGQGGTSKHLPALTPWASKEGRRWAGGVHTYLASWVHSPWHGRVHLFGKDAGSGAPCFRGCRSPDGRWRRRQLQLGRQPGLPHVRPSALWSASRSGSEREAGAQLFSARIGPAGADVTRLLGALLGGDDAPPTAQEQLSPRSGALAEAARARSERRGEEGRRTEPQTGQVLSRPRLGAGERARAGVSVRCSCPRRASNEWAPAGLGRWWRPAILSVGPRWGRGGIWNTLLPSLGVPCGGRVWGPE